LERTGATIEAEFRAKPTHEDRTEYILDLETECQDVIEPIVMACALSNRADFDSEGYPDVDPRDVSGQTVLNGLHALIDLGITLAETGFPTAIASALAGDVNIHLERTIT
jgi:hypothetical protein